ncbi:MAG: bifunctional UDP-sugar hydrolase/5'-nucleotidase [Bauldia litoralis]
MRPRFAVRLALLLLLVPVAGRAETTRITFLHVNDTYRIWPLRGLGGLTTLATLLKRERARAPNAIFTHGGDLISPSLMSGLTKGTHMIVLMNRLGLDVAVLGNHEFDFGVEILGKRVAESRFPWLGANVTGTDGKPLAGLAPMWTRKVGEVTVGLFGVVTPQSHQYIRGNVPVRFQEVVPAARAAVAALKARGATVLVALTHMEIGEDRALARALPGLHLILGGHDHIPITRIEGHTLIFKAGSDAEWLGVVDLDVVRNKGRTRVIPSWRLIANYGIKQDPAILAVGKRYEERLKKTLGGRIGTTSTPLDSTGAVVRSREAAIGNLIADAIRATAKADVALINGGGIRGNRRYPAGSVLTARNVLGELPFNNVVMVLAATGAQLRAALEHGLAGIGEGRFPQVSGMRVTYDPRRPAGSRIVALTVGGQPVDAGKVYRLATNDFLADGGDGYALFKTLKRLVDAANGPAMTNAVIDFIRARDTIAPTVEGRLSAR